MSVGTLEIVRFGVFRDRVRLLCAVSTRKGGHSERPFSGLNLGFHSGDLPERVVENRRLLCEALVVNPTHLVSPQQVHGPRAVEVTVADRGRGALDPETAVPECDGLWTVQPDVPLLLLSADCPLVTVLAPPGEGVALAHAGWRGLATGVLHRTVEALVHASGARREQLYACVSPAIQSCCYEVGPEVRNALSVPFCRSSEKPGHGYLSLPDVVVAQLAALGLRRERIEVSSSCTRCEADRFYSYRRDGPRSGRFGMIAALKD